MSKILFAVAAPDGVISIADDLPQDHRLIGCGFAVQLQRALAQAADRSPDGQSLVVPRAANDLGEGILMLQRRIAATLRPVPDKKRKRLGMPKVAIDLPLWKLLRDAESPLTAGEMRRALGAAGAAINTRLYLWLDAGLVVKSAVGRHPGWALAPGERPMLPPRINRAGMVTDRAPPAIERLWRAMRTLAHNGAFDVPILVITAATSTRAAANLVNVLHRAGYLRQVSRGNGALGTFSTYRLIRDTGRRAPSVKHRHDAGRLIREIVDGNTGARVDVSPSRVSLRSKSSASVADGGVG